MSDDSNNTPSNNEQPEQHPRFIYRGGDQMQAPPFAQDNSMMYGFYLKGQIDKLQATIDRDLNAVANGRYQFLALTDYVMLTFTTIGKSYSTNPQDEKKGWGVEVDTCFWVPVGSVVTKNGKQYLDDIFWYSPFIWVDNPIAMAVGREVYGYPKSIGRFEIPSFENPNHFKATVNSHKHYSPDNEIAWNDILSIDNLSAECSTENHWETFREAGQSLLDIVDSFKLLPPDLHFDEELLKLFLKPQIPQLLLKQFPDVHGKDAVYQALVEAPAIVKKFHGGGLLGGDYQLNLHDVASVPIAADLGLSIGTQTAELGFWLNFDFDVKDARVLVDNSRVPAKKKVAILGGGVSACAAAFGLTSEPGWENKYDITIYQTGWRIGGKGASGRNADMGERIEEHGLHVWLGFYENAFRVMQTLYGEMDKPEGAPLRTWQDAFKPHDFVVNMEYINGQWSPWYLNFPTNSKVPGQGREQLGFAAFMDTLLAYLKQWVGEAVTETRAEKAKQNKAHVPKTFWGHLTRLGERIEDTIEDGVEDVEALAKGLYQFWQELPDKLEEWDSNDDSLVEDIANDIKEWLEHEIQELLDTNATLRHLFIGIDLGITILKGMRKDKIYTRGFDVINDLDLRDWLRKYGANERYTVQSAPVRALYDLVFAYKNGSPETPNLEAGTGLRGMLLLGMGYSGSVMWKMQAGMGDTVFTPFYKVLKKRGVNFQFFHNVDELTLDPSNPKRIQQIKMTRQVDIVNGAQHYDPLVYVKGLGCWPSAPNYAQIVPEQADLLMNPVLCQDNNLDLESYWNNWADVYHRETGKTLPQITLENGKDFDLIINSISVAAQPIIGPELLEVSPPLKAACSHLQTTVTQAYQLWTDKTLTQLGWTHYPPSGQEPILSSFTEPVDTWAAMNQLLCRENWPPALEPKNTAYFCGVQPITEFPPQSDFGFRNRCNDIVRANSINQLNYDIYNLWPDAATPQAFDWSVLTDPSNQQGEDRFNAQYWRSNISPSERYVLSCVNTTQYRISTDGAGFDNLYFTGDWIKNPINAGCVEAATMSGLQTSRAICGHPKVIFGEDDFKDPR